MCKMFEKVNGNKVNGNASMLIGLTAEARRAGKRTALISVPVEMMDIDTRYQIEERTERGLMYLVNNWNEDKLQPVIGVPHWEEGKVYLVDGYGRWIASQMKDKEKYKELEVMMLLKAPTDDEERLKYEAELYAFQNKDVAVMKPQQKHGAMIIMHDHKTETMEVLRKKHGFKYPSGKGGKRGAGVIGSYTDVLNMCGIDEGKCADYVFSVLKNAGFDRITCGYSRYIMYAIRDMYRLYPENREKIAIHIADYLRGKTPTFVKSNANVKYPIVDFTIATSLFIEDILVREMKLKQMRKIVNGKVVKVA